MARDAKRLVRRVVDEGEEFVFPVSHTLSGSIAHLFDKRSRPDVTGRLNADCPTPD